MRIMINGMGRSIEPGESRARANIATISATPFQQYASPGTQVDSGPPVDYEGPTNRVGVGGSDRHLRWYMSIPAIVQKTVWAEQNGYDAVIQSNNFEHGVEASRLAVRIPVLGLCRTTVHVAANFADRIGIAFAVKEGQTRVIDHGIPVTAGPPLLVEQHQSGRWLPSHGDAYDFGDGGRRLAGGGRSRSSWSRGAAHG